MNILYGNGQTYTILKQLGSGSYGQVYKVQDVSSKLFYACKIISKSLLQKYNAESMIRQEISIQSKLNHKNIVKIFNSFEDTSNIYIILEYCHLGSLKEPTCPLSEKEIFNIVYQLMGALDYIHQNEIIHRDLKFENILLHEDGSYKLCDFGWCTSIKSVEQVLCGTTEFMPPEVVLKQYHDYRVDSWSLGVIIYILCHINWPFKGINSQDLIYKIINQDVQVNTKINEDLQILILALLTKDPQQRPTIKQLYLSKWIKKQMKINNLFNKYENESMRNKIRAKNIKIKSIESNGSVIRSIGENSLIKSGSTQLSSSTNPQSPLISKNNLDQVFNFKDVENYTSIPLPQIF